MAWSGSVGRVGFPSFDGKVVLALFPWHGNDRPESMFDPSFSSKNPEGSNDRIAKLDAEKGGVNYTPILHWLCADSSVRIGPCGVFLDLPSGRIVVDKLEVGIRSVVVFDLTKLQRDSGRYAD